MALLAEHGEHVRVPADLRDKEAGQAPDDGAGHLHRGPGELLGDNKWLRHNTVLEVLEWQ